MQNQSGAACWWDYGLESYPWPPTEVSQDAYTGDLAQDEWDPTRQSLQLVNGPSWVVQTHNQVGSTGDVVVTDSSWDPYFLGNQAGVYASVNGQNQSQPEQSQHHEDLQVTLDHPVDSSSLGIDSVFQQPEYRHPSNLRLPNVGLAYRQQQQSSQIQMESQQDYLSDLELSPPANLSGGENEDGEEGVPLVTKTDRRCPLCTHERVFQYPKDLRRHLRKHTGERPHKCPLSRCEYASKGFPRKDSLTRHLKRVHSH